MGSVNSNLEQHACQDQIARVARATVTDAMVSNRAMTPITISELESSSQMSSDLEWLRAIIRRGLGKIDYRYANGARTAICL